MQYRLRTLLIVLAVGPMVIVAIMWVVEVFLEAVMDVYSFRPYLTPWM